MAKKEIIGVAEWRNKAFLKHAVSTTIQKVLLVTYLGEEPIYGSRSRDKDSYRFWTNFQPTALFSSHFRRTKRTDRARKEGRGDCGPGIFYVSEMLLKAHFVRSSAAALISFISRPQNSHLSRCFWDERGKRGHTPARFRKRSAACADPERKKNLLTFPRQSPNLASYSRSVLRWPPAHSAGPPSEAPTFRSTDRPKTRIFGRRPSSLDPPAPRVSPPHPKFQNCRSRPTLPPSLTLGGYFLPSPSHHTSYFWRISQIFILLIQIK